MKDSKLSISTKLINCLKGSAFLLLQANEQMYTDKERKEEMEIIEAYTKYIKDYDKNIKIIEEYNKNHNKIR